MALPTDYEIEQAREVNSDTRQARRVGEMMLTADLPKKRKKGGAAKGKMGERRHDRSRRQMGGPAGMPQPGGMPGGAGMQPVANPMGLAGRQGLMNAAAAGTGGPAIQGNVPMMMSGHPGIPGMVRDGMPGHAPMPGRAPMPMPRAAGGAASDKWIQKSGVDKPGHKGKLHRVLGVPEGEKIPKAKLNKALHSDSTHMRRMAQFAENVK